MTAPDSNASRERISVVVPVFNGASTLHELVERIMRSLDGWDYEVVLVNDGSVDTSWETIVSLARTKQVVRGLDLSRNFGQHNALLAGLRAADGDVIVTLDDDLQNPPEEIPRLLARLEDGFDVVYGTPIERHYSMWRNGASWLVRFSLRSSMGDISSSVGPFRAFRAELRTGFASFAGPYVSLDVLLSWVTGRFATVPVRHARLCTRPILCRRKPRPRISVLGIAHRHLCGSSTPDARNHRRISWSHSRPDDGPPDVCDPTGDPVLNALAAEAHQTRRRLDRRPLGTLRCRSRAASPPCCARRIQNQPLGSARRRSRNRFLRHQHRRRPMAVCPRSIRHPRTTECRIHSIWLTTVHLLYRRDRDREHASCIVRADRKTRLTSG